MPTSIAPPSASTTATPAKRARRKEARPGELLAAALELFVEKGFAATRVDEVAQRAGVSKGTLFLYFPSKEELFKAVVRDSLSGRFQEWNEELKSFPGSSAELLRYAMNQWWERIGSTKASGIPKLVMAEAGNFPELARFFDEEVVMPGNNLIRAILRRGVERGEFRPLDEVYGVYSILAPMLYLSMWKHSLANCCSAEAMDPLKYIASQVDVLLTGITTREAAPTSSNHR